MKNLKLKNFESAMVHRQTGKNYQTDSCPVDGSILFSPYNFTTMEKSYKSTRNSSSTRANRILSLSKGSSSSFFKSFLLTLAILVAGIGSVWGQTQHTVTPTGGTAGNTNGTGSDPICRYYNSNRFQVVYTVAELNAAGLTGSSQITRLAWNVTESSVSLANYTVKMANVTATNSASHNTTATTTVKNAFTYNVALGYNDIVFDVPFTWNGTSNLLIEICTGTTNPFTSPYGGVQAKTGITSGSRSYRVDGAAACAISTNTVHTTKPYVRLTKAATPACSGTPNTGSVSLSAASGCSGASMTATGIGLSTGTGITYQWQSSTDNATWGNIAGATGSTYSPSPTATTYYRVRTTCSNSGITSNSSSSLYTVNCFQMPASGTSSITTCSSTIYEPGGIGNYANNVTSTITIYPTAGQMAKLNFTQFSTESGWDGLVIYNGNSTAAPMIASALGVGSSATNCPAGSYYGTTSPGTVTSTAADGSLTLVFRSDGSTVDVGFTATISCVAAPTCFPPSSLVGTTTSLTSATISWTAASPAPSSGYQYYVSTSSAAPVAGTTPSGSVGAGVTSASLSGLTTGSTYYFWVRGNCGASGNSDWAGSGSFYVGYCIPNSGSGCTAGDLIASVQLNTLSNNSGTACVSAYNDYTSNASLTTTLQPSSSYNVIIGSGAWSQDYAVWIDYNDDGTFDNSTERVGYTTSTLAANSTATFNITLACNPPAGNHRMRVRSAYATAGVNITPCGTQSYGEIEDYLVTIAAAPACPNPGIMTTVTPSFTSVALSWNAGCATGTSYDFQYGPQGFTIGTGTTVTNQTVSLSGGVASYTLSGLTSNTQYSVYYRANCGASTSSWSLVSNFATLCTPTGDETSYGNGSWIGYVYNSASAGAFTTYKGIVTESETFNTSHASTPNGATTNLCLGTNSDLFAIRYKMTKNFPAGEYVFTIGGDDGVRLSVDGGTTWLINQWVDQGYTTASNSSPVALNGSTNLVFEFYENTAGAQSSFSYALAPVPTCATYTFPADGSTGTVVNPTLTWNTAANATSYDVYIGVGSLPATPTANVTTNSYAATLSGLTNYVWKVVPKNAQGEATGCATWSFTTMNVDFSTAWISANTGNAWWCAGETRTVTVTVKNNGAVNWIDGGGVDYNVGIKWNNDVDYPISLRVDANLAAGATGTYSFTVTAPSAGNNNLTFDVVREACFWFGTNASNCGLTAGPGNSAYSVTANVNSTYPTVNAGTDVNACVASTTSLNGTSSVALGGTLLNETFSGTFWTTNDAARWASVATATAGGTTPEARFTYSSGSNGTIVDANIRSSLINASNYTGLTLSFRHMVDWYVGTIPLTAEVSTNGTSWTSVWSQNAAADVAATNVTGVSLAAMNGQSFYLRFRFNGNIWNIDNWYIDNVVITGTGSTNVTPSWSGPNSFSASTLAPTITSVIPGANNYTISSTYLGCTSSDVVQITGTGPTTMATTPTAGSTVWRGATSTDWTTASNWYAYDGTNYTVASATPTASSNVIIPANQGCVTQQPAVAISGTVNANNVTVETGASLTMGTNSLINVAGNFTVNGTGTFTPGAGTVNFMGNGTQVVSIGSSTFNNVGINLGSLSNVEPIVQLTGNTTINGDFTNNSGSLKLNDFNVTIGGNYLNSVSSTFLGDGGLIPGTGNVIFNKASGIQTLSQAQGLDFNTVQHTGAGTLKLESDLSTTGDIINSSGIMDGNDKIITVRNNFTNTATFTSGTQGLGEIYFEKVGGTQTLTPGTATFQKFAHQGTGTLNMSGIVEVKGDVVINAPIIAGTSTLQLSGTGDQTISGTESVIALNSLTVEKTNGNVTLSKPVRVEGTLTMTQGNIVTSSSNKLEIGSSTSSLGSVSWTVGTVVGPMRRWFAGATNSTAASGLFPVGLSTVNRYAQINFTAAPGSGGYIDMEYKSGVPTTVTPWTYLTTPDGQLIQTFENEGYWDITPYDASGNAYPSGLNTSAFTLKLRANGLTSVNDISVTRIIRSPGPDHTTWEPAGFHIAPTGSISDFVIQSNTVTGFSWFNIGAPNNSPLPVELLNFNGTCEEGNVNLLWQTASEFNSSHFDVEKSTDGETWRVMATIPSAGTSNELLTYQTVDNNGTFGSNYYRLRQVDNDGKEKLYDPINVSCVATTTGYFTSYPNPSGNEFQVVVNNKEILGACTLNIVDTQGKVIDQRSIEVKDGINMFVISEKLNPGIYFLNITNGTKTTQVIKHAVK